MKNKEGLQITNKQTNPAIELKKLAAGCRVAFTWYGIKKTLSNEQKDKAAKEFNAVGKAISAQKILLNTKHEAYKSLTAAKNKARAYWIQITLPYPEDGVRLIRQSHIQPFEEQMDEFRQEFNSCVESLQEAWPEIKNEAKTNLGDLYNSSDYPNDITNFFKFEWDFPNLTPPEYLKNLAPDIYAKEESRIQARFQEAVSLAEQAFAEEFHKLVSHLIERLSGAKDGEKKVFRDSAVTNLTEFFDRFKTLSVRSNDGLDKLVEQAKDLVKGVNPDKLRNSGQMKEELSLKMKEVSESLDKMIVAAPRRKIIRNKKNEENNNEE